MFTFALALFAGHRYFSLHVQPLSAFRGERKKKFGRKHSQRKPLTTTTTCVKRRVSNWSLCLLWNILFIFSERKCISKSWRKLMNYKPENRIPWLFPDLEKVSFFPDFCLTVATLDFLQHFTKWNLEILFQLTLVTFECEALKTCTWVNPAINLLILHTFLQIFTVLIYLKSKHNVSFSDGLCL